MPEIAGVMRSAGRRHGVGMHLVPQNDPFFPILTPSVKQSRTFNSLSLRTGLWTANPPSISRSPEAVSMQTVGACLQAISRLGSPAPRQVRGPEPVERASRLLHRSPDDIMFTSEDAASISGNVRASAVLLPLRR
jgi:hypothetical protein